MARMGGMIVTRREGDRVLEVVFFKGGQWRVYDFCNSPEKVGFIKREFAKKILSRIGLGDEDLNEDERQSFSDPSFRELVEEAFLAYGFSWEEMENWLKDCFRLGLNPLPRVRDLVGNICSVPFGRMAGDARPAPVMKEGERVLLCCVSTDGGPAATRVRLELHEG